MHNELALRVNANRGVVQPRACEQSHDRGPVSSTACHRWIWLDQASMAYATSELPWQKSCPRAARETVACKPSCNQPTASITACQCSTWPGQTQVQCNHYYSGTVPARPPVFHREAVTEVQAQQSACAWSQTIA